MSSLATALINWDALWKIVLAAFVAGIGVVLAFGVLLLGVSRARQATSEGGRYAYYGLSFLCGALCLTVVAIGIYAMANKPVSKKPTTPTKSAGLSVASPQRAAAPPF
jgi:hypothetical protein